MKVLVIGQGGREHALVWKLLQSERVEKVYCAPGNGGIEEAAHCVPIPKTDDAGLVKFAQEEGVDLSIVGPEAPLLGGIVDVFQSYGLRIFGPDKAAARIEGSKSYAKELMKKYRIPTAEYRTFTDYHEALGYLKRQKAPIVVKADGLAAGKGVVVAKTQAEAEAALEAMMKEKRFGEAGARVVIEEYLEGQEVSLMAFVDGEVVKPMVPVQDHKPVYDGDNGPNTGGMGAYSPVPQIGEFVIQQSVRDILEPAAKAMVAEGTPYRGVLYAGLMVTDEGPKVVEFNARFGDPETQVVLPRLGNDLVDVLEAVLGGKLHEVQLKWKEEACVCVVLASEGYPGSYPKGREVKGLLSLAEQNKEKTYLFHAGTEREDGRYVTSGGRVLGVTALGTDLQDARARAYQVVGNISFAGMHYRRDIGEKGIEGIT